MDNRILDSLMAEYESLRLENAREEARRQQEIAARHPDLWALAENRHRMVMQAAFSVFSAQGQDDPEAVMQQYNQKIAQGLSEELMGKANEQMARVNEAWSEIKRARGIR